MHLSDRPAPRGFRPEPFQWRQRLELQIESLSNQGAGVARIEGWVVFVPFALPGERVLAEVWRNEGNCSHADLVEVLEQSPHRITPRCRLFERCGGCQYQNLAYEEQLAWKHRQLVELLAHMAQLNVLEERVRPPIASPKPFHYRSKITPHYQKPRKGEISAIGFLAHGARSRIIDVPECPIAMEAINARLPDMRQEAREGARNRKRGATLLLRAHKGGVATNPHDVVEERLLGLSFNFLAGDFFQNNPFILPELVGHVGREAAFGCRFLLDAYCGSGLFAVSLASDFELVTGIEISETSADWARHNARTNGHTNITIVAASAEALFEGISYSSEETAVVIDPPRKGCSRDFLRQLFSFRPRRVVYVSCNPSTQMRDLQAFHQAGYHLEKIQPFDLFPQTKHLECVATLSVG